jgi:hypothetical protein
MSDPVKVRLMYAARTTYRIASAAVLVPLPEYGLRNVAAWATGLDNIDAALVAEADEGIILAFRGTIPPDSPDHAQSVLDWLNDGDALFVPGDDLPGRVHRGFRDSLNNLWPLLEATLLDRAQAAAATTPVYVTGHSKGGSIAFLAAMRCRRALAAKGLRNPVYVCTFAAARPADQDFATAFDAVIQHAVRYEYADDIVPHVPPENVLRLLLGKAPLPGPINAAEEGFVAPGDLHYLERGSAPDDPPIVDSTLLELRRIAGLADRAAKFDFGRIVADHSIDKGSGYANSIAGDR